MATKYKWLLLVVVFTLFAKGVNAQDQQPQTGAGNVSVNDLVGKPADHLGKVQLVGVVAAVSQGKGFVLVDKREYAECGLSFELRCCSRYKKDTRVIVTTESENGALHK